MRSPKLPLLLFLVVLILVAAVVIEANNPTSSYNMNTNYNMYKYDQTVQQFTPDGRLLQIEYAMQAAQHSTPVVLVPLSENLLLITTTRRCPTITASFSSSSSSSSSLLQERLIIVPTGRLAGTTAEAATHLYPEQQHSEMVVVALSGILSDSLSLLEAVQDERFQRQRTFGRSNSGSSYGSTAMMVARTIADKCQQHAFGGGLRPFGATLLVCGIQPWTTASHKGNAMDSNSIALYRTDPSGSILEYSYSSLCGEKSSSSSSTQQQVVIVGGSSLLTRTLERRLASFLQESSSERTVQQQIGNILRILLEEQTNAEQTGTKKDDPQHTNNNDNDSPYSVWAVEAVLVSTEKGILKLSEQQIKRLIEQENAV